MGEQHPFSPKFCPNLSIQVMSHLDLQSLDLFLHLFHPESHRPGHYRSPFCVVQRWKRPYLCGYKASYRSHTLVNKVNTPKKLPSQVALYPCWKVRQRTQSCGVFWTISDNLLDPVRSPVTILAYDQSWLIAQEAVDWWSHIPPFCPETGTWWDSFWQKFFPNLTTSLQFRQVQPHNWNSYHNWKPSAHLWSSNFSIISRGVDQVDHEKLVHDSSSQTVQHPPSSLMIAWQFRSHVITIYFRCILYNIILYYMYII